MESMERMVARQAEAWVVDLTPYTLACWYIFVVAMPLTHVLGLVAHAPRRAMARHVLLYPLLGGRTHSIFSILAWAVWALSLLVAIPVLSVSIPVRATHKEALLGAGAVGGVFAELFCIKSLLTFDPAQPPVGAAEAASQLKWNVAHLPSADIASGAVIGMGALWAVMGVALLVATEYLTSTQSKCTYCILSALCLLVGATTTHGLGGALRHKAKTRWQFFQPFQGGTAFVATQGAGWALFAASLVSLVWLVLHVAAGVAASFVAGIRYWILATGFTMFAAQMLLGASIWTFKGKDIVEAVAEAVSPRFPRALPTALSARAPWHTIWLPILMLYTPVHALSAAVSVTFVLLPAEYAAALWVGGLVIYYALTSVNAPEHTGCREWPAYRQWIMSTIETSLVAWFGNVEVVRDGDSVLSTGGRYIFGYHPHGLFPIGIGYLPMLPTFRQLLPGIHPVALIASVVFFVPLIRDFCSWAGFRQVTKKSFIKALRERGSVMCCPGGQAELVHTHRSFRPMREWVIITHHKGFVRVAIEEGAALVPVVVMGEVDALRNFVDMPRVQAWTYKKLGFPVPYLVVGRWGLSPLPRQTGLKFVIGEPIQPPLHTPGQQMDMQVPSAAVDAMHKQYYDAVVALFMRHKDSFPSYENVSLAVETS